MPRYREGARWSRKSRLQTESKEEGDAQWLAWLALRQETNPKRADVGCALFHFLVWGEPWVGQVVRSFLPPLDARLVSELLWLPNVRCAHHSGEEEARLRVARLRILGGLPAVSPDAEREVGDAEREVDAATERSNGTRA